MLDLSKIEAGTMEFDYAPVDVHGLFIELEDTFRLRNKKSGICICYHRRTTECVVKADRNRLVQVMMNLMNNAVKFTGEGSIEFGFDVREDGFLHFYVTDTGCGIPEERLEEIFGNFVKLNSFVQGTGLGLTIAGQSSKGWEERSVLSHGWVRGVLFGSRCLIRPTKRRFERDVA